MEAMEYSLMAGGKRLRPMLMKETFEMFGGEGETLVLNATHPLVEYVVAHEDSDVTNLICEQLYDLAKLQHAPLEADDMAKFVARSNEIMLKFL